MKEFLKEIFVWRFKLSYNAFYKVIMVKNNNHNFIHNIVNDKKSTFIDMWDRCVKMHVRTREKSKTIKFDKNYAKSIDNIFCDLYAYLI